MEVRFTNSIIFQKITPGKRPESLQAINMTFIGNHVWSELKRFRIWAWQSFHQKALLMQLGFLLSQEKRDN